MPNDAFGQHLATSERFSDEVDFKLAFEELEVYYANILMPLVRRGLQGGGEDHRARLDVQHDCPVARCRVAPRPCPGRDGRLRSRLTKGETEDKIVIAYSTMWGSTDILAREIADGASAAGVDVMLFDIATTPLSHIARHLMNARGLLLGSPTLHHGMLYRTAALVQYVWGLKPKNKIAGVFGSYGWSGGATKQMQARLEEGGFEMPMPDLTCKFKPSEKDIEAARAWGADFAKLVKAKASVE